MKNDLLILVVALAVLACAACASPPGYARAEYVYTEPAQYEYVVPVDRVVVVTRDVLVTRGWNVYRVERDGPNRIIWARRGDDDIVRIFATPHGERVAVRGLWEARERGDHGRHKGWEKRGAPHDIIADIDVRLRAHG
ncbi:MAG TPA: hypothetical protein VH439_05390 [Gemmatimonadales bacterium]|jgi:hypothetical protein